MDEMENQELEFSLDDIMKEFSDHPEPLDEPEEETTETEKTEEDTEPAEQTLEEEKAKQEVSGDTIRMDAIRPVTGDTVRMDAIRPKHSKLPKGQYRGAAPIDDEEEEIVPAEQVQEKAPEEVFNDGWEPEYEQPMGEYIPPQPIVFHPKSRLRELKRKLVNGPEKRYYELSEKGVGRLQAAIFLSLLVVLISAGSTAMYAFHMVQENRLRLMIFGQFFAMLLSALLGSFQLVEGVSDLCKKKFSLNSLLVFTFVACCADAVLCLKQLRVPCCAAFSLEITMSLWNTYHQRSTQISQMDTMRKANHLDSLSAVPQYDEERKGFVRGEGQVEDFMNTYNAPSAPEKVFSIYALCALAVSLLLGITAGILHNISAGVQVIAVTLLAALPASAFITLSRPMTLLQRRLHKLGTVLCGWQGVKGLCGKAVFPIKFEDLFPSGSVRMNGVKFYGSRNPDEIVAYCTAVIAADGGGLTPLFMQVLDSRNGRHYDAHSLRAYPGGGLGAVVEDQVVLVGSLHFLKEMEVDIPEGIRVNQAVCIAIEGELCGLFALTYEKTKAVAAGLGTLCTYRGLSPVIVTNDFTLTESFLKKSFGIKPRKIRFPERETREKMRALQADPEKGALLLVTSGGLPPFAYGVTGARSLYTASILGTVIHMFGGIVGVAMMAVLTVLGAMELLTPVNMFLYQLVWMIPGILITEWTRQI